MPSAVLGHRLMVSMPREFVSHVVSPANTSGPSLLVLMNGSVVPTHVPVSMEARMEIVFPHSWARITSVRRAYPKILELLHSGQTVIPSGMDRGVVPLAPVAPLTHHRGSMYDCPMPQLITLKSGSVVVEFNLKILRYNSWNCM